MCCRRSCRSLQRRFPELRLELRETQTRVLLDELEARRARRRAAGAAGRRSRHRDACRCSRIRSCSPCRPATPRRDRARRASTTSISERLILLEEGHCLRDQALAFCASARRDARSGLGATSLATVMQMVANGYGVTLVPQVAVDVELRDERVKLCASRSRSPAAPSAWRGGAPRRARRISRRSASSSPRRWGGRG